MSNRITQSLYAFVISPFTDAKGLYHPQKTQAFVLGTLSFIIGLFAASKRSIPIIDNLKYGKKIVMINAFILTTTQIYRFINQRSSSMNQAQPPSQSPIIRTRPSPQPVLQTEEKKQNQQKKTEKEEQDQQKIKEETKSIIAGLNQEFQTMLSAQNAYFVARTPENLRNFQVADEAWRKSR